MVYLQWSNPGPNAALSYSQDEQEKSQIYT